MAKGNNDVKPKRSHLYKPYDSANSSLVSRLTTRVSEILPQPSSWLTRWLTPAEQDNFRSENEEVEASTEQQPPPPKRLRMLTPSNDIASPQQNHVRNRLDPEISPILRSRSDQPDGVVAGPSGLHLRTSNFVASTPAVQVPTEPPVKVNGDEGSDGSESTSGCSSLVPQGERTLTAPFPENPPRASKPSPDTPKLSLTPNALGGRRLSVKPKNRTMDLSTSLSLSRSRPSFDPYAFNNPLNKSSPSFNSSGNRTLNDSSASPFYRGRTMYGGNSSCKESLSLSLTSPRVSTPRLVSVKPTSTPVQNRDTISTTSLRILKALEQFSTPVSDMKKVPARSENERRKRKAPPPPFEDLVVPSMPDLLRIKRKERAVSESSTASAAPSTSSAASTPKPYQLPPPVLPLSVRDDVPPEPRRVMRGKNVDEMTSERVEKVNLPAVSLPITTLPSFSLSSLPKTTPNLLTPLPSTPSSTARTPNLTAPTALPSSVSKKTEKPVSPANTYKFGQPIVESTEQNILSIKPAVKFREPVNAETAWKLCQQEDKKAEKIDTPPSKTSNPAPVTVNFQSSPFTFQPKLKKPDEKVSTGFLKTSVDNSAGSVVDFLNKEKCKPKEDKPLSDIFKQPKGSWTCQQCLVPNPADKDKCSCCESLKPDKKEVEEKTWSCSKCSLKNKESVGVCPCGLKKGEKPVQNSWGDLVKVPSDTWECQVCLVRNKNADSSCVSCSTAKAGAAGEVKKPDLSSMFKKPEGNWECGACLVPNKPSDSACVACTTPKPGAAKPEASAAPKTDAPKPGGAAAQGNSWGDLFKKPEGNWDCGECLVSNKAADSSCVACSTPKPGSAKPKPAVTFNFGIPPASTASTAASTASTTPTVTFGIPAAKSESKPSTTGFGGFNFGIPKTDDKKDTEEKAASKFTFGVAAPAPKRAEPEVVEILDDDDGCPPKKRASFGEPPVEEKAVSETPKAAPKFTFGATKSEPSTLFSFGSGASSKPSNIFGSTSDDASSSTDAKTSATAVPSVFPPPLSSNVSSSTDKSDKDALPKGPFSFGVSAPQQNPLFKEKKVDFGVPVQCVTADKPFSIGAVNNATAAPAADTSKVDGPGGSLFGKKESQTLFGMPAPSEAKASGFFNSTENKTGLFNAESTEKNIFGGAKPAFGASNSVFDMKPAASVNSTGFTAPPVAAATVFGSQTAPMNNADKPVVFGSAPSAPSTPFVFKGADATPKAGGFSFQPANPVMNTAPNPFGGFNSEAPKFGAPQPNAVNSAQPTAMFAPTATHIFNSPSPAPFGAFGAPQPEQQQHPQPQAAFTFGSAQPQVQAAATPFFNQVATPTPAQPPAFNPNVKPSFNFTQGMTPSFSAPPSTSTEVKPPAERKIRKAFRRTIPR